MSPEPQAVTLRAGRGRCGLTQAAAKVVWLAALLAAVGFVVRASSSLDARQRAELLAAHNRWRASVGVGPLRWSPRLADRAQSWADTLANQGCAMRHSNASGVGENLFYASARRSGRRREIQPIAARAVVDAWGREAADYSRTRNRCAPGKVCGHYTQIV